MRIAGGFYFGMKCIGTQGGAYLPFAVGSYVSRPMGNEVLAHARLTGTPQHVTKMGSSGLF